MIGERQRRARDQRVALYSCRYHEVEMAREQGFERQLGVGARRRLIYTVLVTHTAAMPPQPCEDMQRPLALSLSLSSGHSGVFCAQQGASVL